MKIIAGSALVLVGALALAAQANRYNQGQAAPHYQPASPYGQQGGHQPTRYNQAAPCRGYNCGAHALLRNCNKAQKFGPYHAYPVRPIPVTYGGHGLYNYRGYARHIPLPPISHRPKQRHACRGYKCAPRRPYAAPAAHYRPAPAAHYGAAPTAHYARPAATHYSRPAAAPYGLKPVKALALAPATYTDSYAAPKPAYGANQNGYRTSDYRQQDNNRYRAESYGGQYNNNNNNYNHQQTYRGAGKKAHSGSSSGGY